MSIDGEDMPARFATGYERVHSLAELMGRSDVVSVHAPLSAETRGLLGTEAFAAMRMNRGIRKALAGRSVEEI